MPAWAGRKALQMSIAPHSKTPFPLLAIAAVAISSASCGGPAEVSAEFDITLTGDGDGCGIPSWTIAPERARLVLLGTDMDLVATVLPVPESRSSVLRDLIATGTLRGSGTGSDFEARASADTAIDPCASPMSVSITGAEEAGTLLGTVRYEPPSSCMELAGCSATQVFSGVRLGGDCYDSGLLVTGVVSEVARGYRECEVAADCALVAIDVSCGDGALYGMCPIAVSASREEEYRREAAREAAPYCVPGCLNTPSCLSPTVVCVDNLCATE